MKERAKVLIIDDNTNLRETMADVLEEKGYATTAVGTAREAIQTAQKSFFNLHLIDINLPDKTGIELLKYFKSAYPIRINIMITASATMKHAVDALNIGANAFILKPIDFNKLEQVMKEWLRKQEPTLKATEERLTEFMANTTKTTNTVEVQPAPQDQTKK